jgi:hypothetical protein
MVLAPLTPSASSKNGGRNPDSDSQNEENHHPPLYLGGENTKGRSRVALAREGLARRNAEPKDKKKHTGSDEYLGNRLRAEAEVGSNSSLLHHVMSG